jgi:hypothetical protein
MYNRVVLILYSKPVGNLCTYIFFEVPDNENILEDDTGNYPMVRCCVAIVNQDL